MKKTYEIMDVAADAEGNTLFIIVDANGLSVEPTVGYDTYAEAHDALLDLEEAETQREEADAEYERNDPEGVHNWRVADDEEG